MGLRNVLEKMGMWTTVHSWGEPYLCRIRLRRDWVARGLLATGCGVLAAGLLLIAFAASANPPHPMGAGIFLLFGALFAATLQTNSRSNAGGRVRICRQGIIRVRHVGVQWFEEMSWPYESLQKIVIVPPDALGCRFALLVLVNDSGREIIGVPMRFDLKELGEFLIGRGVTVTVGRSAPEEFCRPLRLLVAALVCGVAGVVMVGASIFYAVNVGERKDQRPLAFEKRKAQIMERNAAAWPRSTPPQFEKGQRGNYPRDPVAGNSQVIPPSPPASVPPAKSPAAPTSPTRIAPPTPDATIAADLPVIPAGTVRVDLLSQIEPTRDQVMGLWSTDSGCLISPSYDTASLVIPSAVPKEYVLTIVAERVANSDSFGIGLLMNGRQVLVVLEGWGKTLSGLNTVDGRTADNNDTTYRSPVFVAGSPCTIVCSVRDSHIQVACDGRTVIDWRGNAHRLALDRRFWSDLPSDKLFLGTWHSSYRISKLELVSLSE